MTAAPRLYHSLAICLQSVGPIPTLSAIIASARLYGRPPGKLAARLLGLAGGVILLAGCAIQLPTSTLIPNTPETKIIDLRSALVMKAVVRVLRERKFVVNAAKTTPQSLETEWLQDGPVRSMVLAGVKPLGKFQSELTVQLRVEKKTFWHKIWQPYDKIERTAYDDLMNDVLIEGYRILYDGR